MSRPNILLIISDDQTYESLDSMAGSALDPMAKTKAQLGQGIRFNRCYAASPLCAPSRATMFTGKYPHNNGVIGNFHASKAFRRNGLQYQSAAKYLADEAGYDCGYFGKYINDYEDTAGWQPPPYRGWVSTFRNREPMAGNVQGTVKRPRKTDGSFVARKQETNWVANRAIAFIQDTNRDPETPWFVVCAPDSPHYPYTPSSAHEGLYNNTSMPLKPNYDHYDPGKPSYLTSSKPLTTDEKLKYRDDWRGSQEELMDLDGAIENLCNAVDFETTYVFFISDNGFFLGEHRLYQKGAAYEEAIRLPFFVRGPGMRENATSEMLVSAIDIPATILELAGLDPVEKEMDGRSLVGPMFQPDESLLEWRDAFFIEQIGTFWLVPIAWRALRTSSELYVEYDDGFIEYYNTDTDPYELTNIAAQADAVRLHQLSSQLSQMKDASGETLRSAEVPTTV